MDRPRLETRRRCPSSTDVVTMSSRRPPERPRGVALPEISRIPDLVQLRREVSDATAPR